MERLQVLFHINESDRWNVVLGNITNLIRDVGAEAADIVVLANGYAVYGYADPEKITSMEQLNSKGVKFLACRNSLKNMCEEGVVCIKEELLPPFLEVVPAGITEVVKRQRDGYAYVKP